MRIDVCGVLVSRPRPHDTGTASPISSTRARPATAPRFRFGRAHAVSAGRVAVCRITGKRSGHPTQRMRARRPRSRWGASSHPSCSARRHCPCRCGRAVPLRVSSVKHPILKKDEPRMNTNGHEDRWTCLAATPSREEGRERGRPARTTLAQPRPSPPPGLDRQRRQDSASAGSMRFPPAGWPCAASGGNGAATQPRGCGRDARAPGGGRLLPSFSLREEALPCRCGRAVPLRVSSVKHPIVNKDEPRMNTNGHEFRWTCLAATPSREDARERGRPARTTVAQPRPSSRPGSTGNGATIPLQPSPGGFRRQGGRVPHHGETERPPNPEDAGETPALPVGRLLPSFSLGEEALPLPMRQSRPASCVFGETPHRQ